MAFDVSRAHTYQTRLTWRGSTGIGYRGYDRNHRLVMPPAVEAITASADATFRGDPRLPNPESLLLAAASSCQLLSFLAVAAQAGVDVVSYDDDAEAIMPTDVEPVRITRVTLRPRIVVAVGTDLDVVHGLVARAHEECYVANTLNADMVLEPTVAHTGTLTG
jgi:organic hydroperoxide reductase OsmC/OhrA